MVHITLAFFTILWESTNTCHTSMLFVVGNICVTYVINGCRMNLCSVRKVRIGCFYENCAGDKLGKVHGMMEELQSLHGHEADFVDLRAYCQTQSCVRDDTLDSSSAAMEVEENFCKMIDVVLVLGGDGTMLQAMHRFIHANIPFYGINIGSIGFLLNAYDPSKLLRSVVDAVEIVIHPLEVSTIDVCGTRHMVLAVNEVSLLRNSAQSAHVRVAIDGSVRLDKLVADGVLLSTPAGSTAYNYAAGGMIVPLETRVLLITPISPFRPRRWRGAVVPDSSVVQFVNLMTDKRPINVAADSVEMRDAVSATAVMRHDIEIRLLFDKENCIQERVMKEQFAE